MRRGLSAAMILLVALLSLQACKKKKFEREKITIVNQLGVGAMVEIYSNEADYANATNPIASKYIPADEVYEIDGGTFTEGNTYYMDWYSDDYYYSNWYNDDFPISGKQRVRISPSASGARVYYMEQNQKGFNRSAFLKGNSNKTNWIAVDAYLYSASTGYLSQWSNLTQAERYRTITINKDFTANYNRRGANGNPIAKDLEFIVHEANVPYIEFISMQGLTAGSMTGGELPTAPPPDYKSSSLDTVMALFPDNDVYFMMVRQ